MALLDEAVDRAGQVLAESRPELDEAARAAIAHDVGIGAVKYADLVGLARQRVHLRLRPDAVADRQHRPLPAVRRRADPLDPPQGVARPATPPARSC